VSYLIVNGERYEEPESLTLGEARDIKRISGAGLDEWGANLRGGDPDSLAALLYVVMRRKDPSVTEADIDAIDAAAIGGMDEENPPGADEASG